MRRPNGQRHATEAPFTGAPGGGPSPSQPHEAEPFPAAHLANELTDGDESGWEAAWIDLGGEG
jgi:hypothetical protein